MCQRRFLANDERAGMEAAMKVAIYLRVSTEEQRERQSIETQRDFGERYCELHQMPISEFYVDDGVSGTIPLENRPGGKRILEGASKGKVAPTCCFSAGPARPGDAADPERRR